MILVPTSRKLDTRRRGSPASHLGIYAPSGRGVTLSTDVAQTIVFPHLGNMLAILDDIATEQENSGADLAMEIAEKILASETFEDLFRAQEAGTTSGKEFVNRPFLFKPSEVTWKRSREGYINQGGFPFFFFARVLDLETGEEVIINCGGKTVVAMVYKMCHTPSFWEGEHANGRAFTLRANQASESDNEFLTIHPAIIPGQRTGGKK